MLENKFWSVNWDTEKQNAYSSHPWNIHNIHFEVELTASKDVELTHAYLILYADIS